MDKNGVSGYFGWDGAYFIESRQRFEVYKISLGSYLQNSEFS